MINKDKIKSIVKEIEKSTTAEIVPSILDYSDNYPASYYRAGLFFASLGFIISWFFFRPWIFYFFLIGYLIGILLCFIPFIKRLFIFSPELEEETLQKGYEIFLEHKIHQTSHRSGVLVMLSLFEKRAIILADKKINDLVDDHTWVKIIDNLIQNIKTQNIQEAFEISLRSCGEILSKNLPGNDKDKNELDNNLIS